MARVTNSFAATRIQEVVGGLEPPGGSLDRDFPGGSGRDKNRLF
jgi:hypothetical protein